MVGAGPGSPDLITVRGLRILMMADAIVHDRLVDDGLILQARSEAEIFDVGKTPGVAAWTQSDINNLLIRLAKEGKKVVRLKGGDPFVFGRGGEEQAVLRDAYIAVEIVPGVTSATGVPASLGVPLTHRATSSDFAVLTGQFAADGLETRDNWDALAQIDTLVILMGLRTVAQIQKGLLSAGKGFDTPILLVSAGSLPWQKVERTKLGILAQTVQEGDWASPSLMIIGKVVEHWSGQKGETEEGIQEFEISSEEERSLGLYPVTLTNMKKRQVLVVGGGNVGTRKCQNLLKAGAQVVLCSPVISEALQARISSGELIWLPRKFRSSDLEGKFLVFAATDDPQLNRDIHRLGVKNKILCNVASDASEGDFWVPATSQTEDCTVAFSSLVGRPQAAQQLRSQFEALWLQGE